MEHEVSSFGNKLAEKRPENINYLEELYSTITDSFNFDNSETIRVVQRIEFTDQMVEIIFHNDTIQYGSSKKGVIIMTIYLSDCDANVADRNRFELRRAQGVTDVYKRVVTESEITREKCNDLEVNNLVRDVQKMNLTHRDEQL